MSDFNTHGGFFSPKGYMKVEAGGSHKDNPNGGVQIGMDAQGIPNLLEEGEPVYNDYVFSDNIKANKSVLNKFNIPDKYAGMYYSDIADKFMDEAGERPNDFISNNGLEAMLNRLADAQEYQKQQAQERKLAKEIADMTPEEQAMLVEAMAQQSAPQEQVPVDAGQMQVPAGIQMPMQPEMQSAPLMAGLGGCIHRFDMGGATDVPPDGTFVLPSGELSYNPTQYVDATPFYDRMTALRLSQQQPVGSGVYLDQTGAIEPVIHAEDRRPAHTQAWLEAENHPFKTGVTSAINDFGERISPVVIGSAFGPAGVVSALSGEAVNTGVNAITGGEKNRWGDLIVDPEKHPIANAVADMSNPGYGIEGILNAAAGEGAILSPGKLKRQGESAVKHKLKGEKLTKRLEELNKKHEEVLDQYAAIGDKQDNTVDTLDEIAKKVETAIEKAERSGDEKDLKAVDDLLDEYKKRYSIYNKRENKIKNLESTEKKIQERVDRAQSKVDDFEGAENASPAPAESQTATPAESQAPASQPNNSNTNNRPDKKIEWGKLLGHFVWDPTAVWRYTHPGNGWGWAGKIAAGTAHDALYGGLWGGGLYTGAKATFGKNPPENQQNTQNQDEWEDLIVPANHAMGGRIAREYDGLTYPTGALIRTNYAKTLPKIVAPAVTNSGSTIGRDLSDISLFTPGDIGYYYLTQGRYPAEQNVTTQLTSETDEIAPSHVTDYRLPVARVQGPLKPMPSITGSATTSFGGFTSPSFGLYTPGDLGYYYLTHGRYPVTEPVTRTELVSTPDEELDASVVTANRLTGNKWVDNPGAQLVWPEQRLGQNGEIDPAVVTEEYIPYLGELEEAVAIGNRPTKPTTATSVTTSTNSTTGSPAQPSPVATGPSVADTVASTSPAAVGLNRNAILDAAIKIASGAAPAVSSSSSVSQSESGSGSAVLRDPDTGEPTKTTVAATLAPLSVSGKNAGAVGAAGRMFHNLLTPPTVFPEQMIRPAYIDEEYTFQPLRYVSSDPNLTTNALLANAARQDRLAGNSGYGPSAGIVRRANMNAVNSAIGAARAQEMLANEQNRNNVISANNTGYAQEAAYNSGIDQFNAQAAMNTNIRNVQNEMLRRRYNDAAETAQYQAIGNELQNLEDQIVANARQRFIVNQLRSNPALYQLAALNGFNVYNVGANGGLLLKKPKK